MKRKIISICIIAIFLLMSCSLYTVLGKNTLKNHDDLYVIIHKGDKSGVNFFDKIKGCDLECRYFGGTILVEIYFNVSTYEISGSYLGSTDYAYNIIIGNNTGSYYHITPQIYVKKLTYVKATAVVNGKTYSKFGFNIGPFILFLI